MDPFESGADGDEVLNPTPVLEPATAATSKNKKRPAWREFPVLILSALLVAVILKTFVVSAYYIPSGSMLPTLEVNDRVLVSKLSFRIGDFHRGDIIVFDDPFAPEVQRSLPSRMLRSVGEALGIATNDRAFIKRVIGLGGETVEIKQNQVLVDGIVLDEPYLPDDVTMPDYGPQQIPLDHVFVMGDNRGASSDSRIFQAIPSEDVVGKAFVRVWPPGRLGGL